MAKVTPEQVVKALVKHPGLLIEVRSRLMNIRACGPWMNTGKRFGNRDTRNVWGLPRTPQNKKEKRLFDEHPNDASVRKFAATVRPTEEWGDLLGQEHPGKWYWNVNTGNEKDNGSGVVDTQVEAMEAAEWHLQTLGWIVVGGTVAP